MDVTIYLCVTDGEDAEAGTDEEIVRENTQDSHNPDATKMYSFTIKDVPVPSADCEHLGEVSFGDVACNMGSFKLTRA